MSKHTIERNLIIFNKLLKSIDLDAMVQVGIGGVSTTLYGGTTPVPLGTLAWTRTDSNVFVNNKKGVIVVGTINKQILEKSNKLNFIYQISIILNDMLSVACDEIGQLKDRTISFTNITPSTDGNYNLHLKVEPRPGESTTVRSLFGFSQGVNPTSIPPAPTPLNYLVIE